MAGIGGVIEIIHYELIQNKMVKKLLFTQQVPTYYFQILRFKKNLYQITFVDELIINI